MRSPSNKVVGAVVVGVFLVVSALTYNTIRPVEYVGNGAALTVVESPSFFGRAAIPERDFDGDGVPDWQAALANIDVPELYNASGTSGVYYETLTEEVGINLFQMLIAERAQIGSEDAVNQEKVVGDMMNELADDLVIDIWIEEDIEVIPESQMTVENTLFYYNEMSKALQMQAGVEVDILSDLQVAVQTGDDSALEKIKIMHRTLEQVVQHISELRVPERVVDVHLDLLNALRFVEDDVRIFTTPMQDPIRTLINLQRFRSDLMGVVVAYENFLLKPDRVFDMASLTIPPDSDVWWLVFEWARLTGADLLNYDYD